MTPNANSHTTNTIQKIPHAQLFDSTLWQVLPAHYDKIKNRWILIARLYHEARNALMTTDHAAGTNSLKAELEMLVTDMNEYREIVKSIGLENIAQIYIVVGRQKWRAEQIAKEDIQDLEKSLKELEDDVRAIRADVVYGFEDKE
jgi:hypothetical protein